MARTQLTTQKPDFGGFGEIYQKFNKKYNKTFSKTFHRKINFA